MKKVTSILATTLLTLSIFGVQLADNNANLKNYNTIACGDCDNPIDDDRGN